MASLKSLLRTLMTSFRGSHKSVPNIDYIAVDKTITSGPSHIDENSYVAPSDGVLIVQVVSPAVSLVIRKRGMDWAASSSYVGPWYACSVPCKAGETINFSVESTQETTQAHLRFYKYVGE